MAQVVLAGRQELIKIQTGQTVSSTAETNDSKPCPSAGHVGLHLGYVR